MKETKIEIPAGCEVEKVETQDGHVVVTFREKERRLPKSWDEFCDMVPIHAGECYIQANSDIADRDENVSNRWFEGDRNLLPDRATAEMKEYNGFYNKLKSHGVTMYAVAKVGGWSWQQVAEWANGTRVPQIATFKTLQRVMDVFGIGIDVDDFGKGGKQ